MKILLFISRTVMLTFVAYLCFNFIDGNKALLFYIVFFVFAFIHEAITYTNGLYDTDTEGKKK